MTQAHRMRAALLSIALALLWGCGGDTGVDTPLVIFGNLRHVYFGDRRRMTMAQSTHVGFTTDQVYLRVIQRMAVTVALPEAFAVLKTAAV